jgi:hypothetical protein
LKKRTGKSKFVVTKQQTDFPEMKTSLSDKIREFFIKVKIVQNLARQKFVFSFLLGLIKSRKVQFCEVAQHLNEQAQDISNEVRIQDFFRQVDLDYEQVALLMCLFLNPKGKIRLCIDRTEWDFGKCQVNLLMVLASQGAVQVPLYWELLDNKSGNSSTQERKAIIAKCIRLLGKGRIGLLIADREFVGHVWLKYLKDNGIAFCVRLPKHHLLERPDGRVLQPEKLAQAQALHLKDCLVDGVWGQVYLKRLTNGDLLYLFGSMQARYLGQLYHRRWTIEACFQSLKSRGFDLESTHLKDLTKLKKLVALVSIAFGMCVSLGIYQHKKVKNIKVKNHGYKANSFFRHGLNTFREMLKKDEHAWQLFTAKFIRWLNLRLSAFKLKILAG